MIRRVSLCALAIALSLALPACANRYGVRFTDTSVAPLQTSLSTEQAMLFEEAVLRTTMNLTVEGSVSNDAQESDLELRSDNPQIVAVYRGVDAFTFVLVGASAGQTQLGAYFQDKRVATISASVTSQRAP